MIGLLAVGLCLLRSSRVDEICIAVAEWAKAPTTSGPSLCGVGATGAMLNAYRAADRSRRPAAVPGSGAVAGWG